MQHSGKILILVLIAVIFVAAGLGYTEYARELTKESKANEQALTTVSNPALAAESQAHQHDHTEVKLTKIDPEALKITPHDLVLGNPKAAIKIVEYASLSCPHCADFHQTVMPELKKHYIETGKIAFIFRHFPLNAPAMKAAMAVDCAPQATREALLSAFFEQQRKWAFDSEYIQNIAKISSEHGLDNAALEACFANTAEEDRILKSLQTASEKLTVASTPTFFVNNKRIAGTTNFEKLEEAIKAAQ